MAAILTLCLTLSSFPHISLMLIWSNRKGATGNDDDGATTGTEVVDDNAVARAGTGEHMEVEGVGPLWHKATIKLEDLCQLVLSTLMDPL